MSSNNSAKRRWLTGDRLFNITLLGVLLAILMSPGGRLRSVLDGWWVGVVQARALESNWDALQATTSLISRGEGSEIEIIEFGDYECPFCKRVHPELEKFLGDNPEVVIAYRHYPLVDLHPVADDAAKVAICAEEQGRFLQMHVRLLEEENLTAINDWTHLAADAGVGDLDTFSECLGSTRADQRLARDVALGKDIRIQGTPTFVFRDGIHQGLLTVEQLEEWVSNES